MEQGTIRSITNTTQKTEMSKILLINAHPNPAKSVANNAIIAEVTRRLPEITEFPAGSPGLEPREECGLSKFF